MNFVKENKKPFIAIKTTTNLHNREALRKLHVQIEIASCLRYGPKSFNL